MEPKTLLDWALDSLNRGFAIFPLEPGKKSPLTSVVSHGCLDATRDETIVRQWWKDYPDANIGVACGQPSGMIVFDIDKGLPDVQAAREFFKLYRMPMTFCVHTGRRFDKDGQPEFGLHFFFAGNCPNKPFHEGMFSGEVRSTGLYVVGPGSIHPDSGEQYEVLIDAPLAPIPDFVFKLSQRNIPRPQGRNNERVGPSYRHYFLCARALELVSVGYYGDGLVGALRILYDTRCERDEAKDRIVDGGELEGIARWAEDHALDPPMEPRDYAVLKCCEQKPLFKEAWSGNLLPFDGNYHEAMGRVIDVMCEIGCSRRDDQIRKILKASPLYKMIEETEEHDEETRS